MSAFPTLRHLSNTGVADRYTITAAACLGLLFPMQGFAASTDVATESTQIAEQPQAFSIPAGPLSTSLNALSRAAGLTLAVNPAQVAGKSAPALSGTFTPQQALERLLAGSGLVYRFTDVSTVTLSRADTPETGGQTAENPEPEEPLRLGPVVVEGELQTRTLQETQTSVAVITGEELETRSDTSLRSIAERTAGISTTGRGVSFVIRGVDERGVDANGPATPAITTNVDGLRITDFGRINTTFLSTWDLEQLEVLRGPQSTQSGRNALAGAVILRSKDPTYDQEFKLRGGGGNFNSYQTALAFNQPIIQDKVAVRFSGEINETDGFVDNITTGADDEGRVENTTARASIRFDPSDNLWSILKLSYIDGFDGFASSDSAFLPDAIDDTDAETSDDFRYRSANLRFGYSVSNDVSIESETVYSDRNFLFSGDFDGGPNPISTFTDDIEGESISQELKIIYDTERVGAVLGGFFTRIEEDNVNQGVVLSTLVAPPALLPFLTPGSTVTSSGTGSSTVENWALFGEIDVEVVDSIRLIAGARYDNESRDANNVGVTSTNDPVLAPLLPTEPPTPSSSNFEAFLPKAGVVYEFTDDVSLGFTYQRGYRAGGASFNSVRQEQFEFDPEFTNNYELAFRSQWLDKSLTVNANAYFVDYEDQQLVVALSNQPLDTETQNAGSSESYGAEVEVQALLFDNLDVFASVGYNQTEFKDFISNGVQLAGNEFRNAPKWTGSVGGTYYFDNGIYFGADASYTSSSFADAANTRSLRSDSRFLMNVRAGFEVENFNLFLYANNVFDRDYVEERGQTLSTVGAPRTFGVIGQVQF